MTIVISICLISISQQLQITESKTSVFIIAGDKVPSSPSPEWLGEPACRLSLGTVIEQLEQILALLLTGSVTFDRFPNISGTSLSSLQSRTTTLSPYHI